MKRILFSTTHFDTIENGPAFFVNLLAENIKESDKYDLRILTEDVVKGKPKRKNIFKLRLQQNVLNRFFYQFFRIKMYHKEAVKIQDSFNYDVLVYNNAFTGVKSCKNVKKPVVVMINDYNRIDFIHKGISLNKAYFKNLVLFKLEKKAALLADTVIVNSLFLKETVQKMYGISKDRIKVLYKGIDLTKYHFRLRKKFGESINILFVKGGYQNGGLYELIEAISLLKEYKIKLTIIGPRIIDLATIENYIKEKDLKDYEIKGPTHPEEVREYFKKADIFCVPSHKEALGVANMEALASGVPVVSSNVGGIPEVLDYGKCGWLVAPNNAKQLAEALKECIDNPILRIEKSRYGFEFVKKFNSDRLVDSFLNIIDEVIPRTHLNF